MHSALKSEFLKKKCNLGKSKIEIFHKEWTRRALRNELKKPLILAYTTLFSAFRVLFCMKIENINFNTAAFLNPFCPLCNACRQRMCNECTSEGKISKIIPKDSDAIPSGRRKGYPKSEFESAEK